MLARVRVEVPPQRNHSVFGLSIQVVEIKRILIKVVVRASEVSCLVLLILAIRSLFSVVRLHIRLGSICAVETLILLVLRILISLIPALLIIH